MKLRLAFPLALLAIAGFAPRAIAHMIETDFSLFGEELEFQSTFSTGEPVQEAQVTIYSPDNPDEPWAELTTDEEGRFSFNPDEAIAGNWEIRIDQGIGHTDLWTVPVNAERGVDYDNITSGTPEEPTYFASMNPYVLGGVGVLGLGAFAGGLAYAARNRRID
ncbi:MAG: carboxypeptidase regulatory-like domain-containing protein [Leptolyngbyaceae bacterium]|nr:carboxypeptidase regulatory-like domain-containing protein [Leptolyngbyaceae bacterium]